MNHRERHEFNSQLPTYTLTTEEAIKRDADDLISALYIPTKDRWILDYSRLKKFGIDENEPVNWGDLSSSVEKLGEIYIVTLEEAAPDGCVTLCDYIASYLTAFGWNVRVVTEW